MHRKKPSASSTAIALCLLIAALGLPGCKTSSTRPSTPPTPQPPPTFNCDRTPPAPRLTRVPALLSAVDLPVVDAWIRVAISKYTALLITHEGEHACVDALRSKGVIR